MQGIVAPTCGELKKLLEENEINEDNVSTKAAVLNEAGYLLLDDGRCPDGDGAKASETLKSTSAAILEAVGKREASKKEASKKEASAAKEAFNKLTTDGCAACDKVHKT